MDRDKGREKEREREMWVVGMVGLPFILDDKILGSSVRREEKGGVGARRSALQARDTYDRYEKATTERLWARGGRSGDLCICICI